MSDSQNSCDQSKIDAFMRGDEAWISDAQLIEHLEQCEKCQSYMEQSAALPKTWDETAEFLQPGDYDSASSAFNSSTSFVSAMSRMESSAEPILRLLTKSEAPDSLGRLDEYEIMSVIGTGGMGVVFKAFDPSLNRPVAIKVLGPHLALSGSANQRFAREAKAVAVVRHPNVIAIHRVSEFKNLPYLVMPFVPGGSLQDVLKQGPLPTNRIVSIAAQVAAGLDAAHSQGLVHRDIKPANILIDSDQDSVVLTDFGLARAVDDVSITRQGSIAGTPEYMSPEQASGKVVQQSSDLFSLGSVMYAMCTGQPPFQADNSLAVMRQINEQSPTPISQLNPAIPNWLSGVVDRLMEKSPSNRFESASSVAATLQQCEEHLTHPDLVSLPEALSKVGVAKSNATKTNVTRSGAFWLLSFAVLAILTFGAFKLYKSQSGGSSASVSELKSDGSEKNTTPRDNEFAANQNALSTTLQIGSQVPTLPECSWPMENSTPQMDTDSFQIVNFCATKHTRYFYAMTHWAQLKQDFPNFRFTAFLTESESAESNGAVESQFAESNLLIGFARDESSFSEWSDLTEPPQSPHSFVIDPTGRLVWHGEPEGLQRCLQRLEAEDFTIETARKEWIEEGRIRREFTQAMEGRNWDVAMKLLPRMRNLAPKQAGELDLINFKLRLNDPEKSSAFTAAEAMLDDYPGQPEIIRELADRLSSIFLNTMFDHGSVPEHWKKTALKLSTQSVSLTQRKSAKCLATLARIHDAMGDIENAIKIQIEALDRSEDHERTRMKTVLGEYQQSLEARG